MKFFISVLVCFLFTYQSYAMVCKASADSDIVSKLSAAKVLQALMEKDLALKQIQDELAENFINIYKPLSKGDTPKVEDRATKALTDGEKNVLAMFKLLDSRMGLDVAIEQLLADPRVQAKLPENSDAQSQYLIGELVKLIRFQFEILGLNSENSNSANKMMDWHKHGEKLTKKGKQLQKELKSRLAKHPDREAPETRSLLIKSILQREFQLKFGQSTNAEILSINRHAFAKRRKLVQKAKKSIFISIWSIYDDKSGVAYQKDLVEAAARGVEIKIIVDGNVAKKPKHNRIINELALVDGIDVVFYHDKEKASFGYHVKTMIVDSEHLLTGGRNVGDVYTSFNDKTEKWLDTDIYTKGSVALVAENRFRKDWVKNSAIPIKAAKQRIDLNESNQSLSAYYQQEAGSSKLMDMMILSIYLAEFEVNIANAYVISNPALKAAIQDAISRKVKVSIFTNSQTSVDEPVVSVPILMTAKEYAEMGAKVYLKKGSTLHSKTMLIDRRLSFIGSLNFHPRSAILEAESAFVSLNLNTSHRLVPILARDYHPSVSSLIDPKVDSEIPYNLLSVVALRLFYEQL
ncbi:MAG: phosphatidylserine/phosphatidylglycerophosphate/cardiolipin synthase family protein [Bdellovibrionota bacterium]|nr:phosphatidylserine/phosphatidylglycerophosphate/cardiolipin synthase family protein [Bdellovibrionota bacterium]